MKTTLWLSLAVTVLSLNTSCEKKTDSSEKNPGDQFKDKVIYGPDNRKDLFEVADPRHIKWARSTVAIVNSYKISDLEDGTSEVHSTTFGYSYQLCPSEPYYNQPNPAHCSGFLVGDDLIVTAGHCAGSQNECKNIRFIFDYSLFLPNVFPKVIETKNIYSCKELIYSEVHPSGSDFSVIRLARKVTDRHPLPLRRSSIVSPGTPLTVIGHPAGLPTKVANGAKVRSVHNDFFRANLDTYGGNSGSAVFNDQTGEVEGILVRGETDFKERNGCYVSYQCTDTNCRGEDATKITRVLDHVPLPTPKPEPSNNLHLFTKSRAANLSIPDNTN